MVCKFKLCKSIIHTNYEHTFSISDCSTTTFMYIVTNACFGYFKDAKNDHNQHQATLFMLLSSKSICLCNMYILFEKL